MRIKNIGTIGTIQNDPEFILITDPYEVEETLKLYYNKRQIKRISEEIGSLFVKIEGGEYTRICGFWGTVPNLSKTLWEVVD